MKLAVHFNLDGTVWVDFHEFEFCHNEIGYTIWKLNGLEWANTEIKYDD